jgi:aminopeptidase YwaD
MICSACGHRDGPIPLGANDNGSGISCQLEIAQALSEIKPKRSIEFIFSTAEEGIAPGAREFARAHKERLPNMKALINIDMVGVGGS